MTPKRAPRVDRIARALDRMDRVLVQHPEIRARTAEFLAGKLPALEDEGMGKLEQTSMYLPTNLLKRAGDLVDRLAESDAGALLGTPTRSDVLRLAVKRGIEALETELPKVKRAAPGTARRKKNPPPKRRG